MSPPVLLPLLVLAVAYAPPAVVLARIDLREHRLPNRWVGLLTAAVAIGLILCALIEPALRAPLRSAAVLALVLGLGAVLLALLAPQLLGMGDAKTLPAVVLMSGALGGEELLAALLGIALLGGIVGSVLLLRGRSGERFAYGPILLSGPVLGLAGAPLVAAALGTA